jgi:DNA-binding NtrC family response regulator
MQNVLLAAGYHVESVGTMSAGLACVEANRYDLILTDERLPDGRGVQIADRATELGMDAVVITGYGMNARRADADRHEFLLKPMRPEELVEAVDRHVTDK